MKMKNLLSGKMYWVQDDFNFDGLLEIKIGSKDSKKSYKDSEHITTKIENIVIDEFVIKFTTKPYKNIDGTPYSYSLNLTSLDKEFHYKGSAKSYADEETKIEVSCEIFDNKKKYILFGKWVEYDEVYTWWAIINKSNPSR